MADVRLDLVIDGSTIVYDGGAEVIRVDHAPKIRGVTVSAVPPSTGQTLVATSDTTAEWGAAAGNVTGPDSSTVGHVVVFDSTDGAELADSGVAYSDLILEGDARLTNARTPTSHATSHQNGGADEISVAGLSGVLADPQTAAAHAASHRHGGADEVATVTPGANAIPKAGSNNKLDIGWFPLGTTSSDLVVGDDSRLSNARTPTAHKTSHEVGGADQISVAGLSGLLATAQTPAAHVATHQLGGSDQLSVDGLSGLLDDPQTPTSHASTHENGGTDELDVDGLSGELADPQGAYKLVGDGWEVSVSGAGPSEGDVLRATDAGTMTWQAIASGGDVVGPSVSVAGHIAVFDDTTGKLLDDGGIYASDLIQDGDPRLDDPRTPTAHASLHQHGGADEVGTATAAANAIPKADGTGKLAIAWIPTGSSGTTVCVGNDSRLSDARTPTSHASTHQSGGGDQISIAGLSGRGASNQTADQIATSGTAVSISTTAPSANQFLRATSATAASWQTVAFGDVNGPGSSTNGNVPTFSGTGGKTLVDSGTALSSLVLTSDSRLSDARTPTSHASSHQHGGADQIATATAAANAIPKAGAGGTLAIGWIPTGTSSSTVCIGNDSRLSDARTANAIATSGTPVSISTTPPSAGQVLQASSATAAAWVTPTTGGAAGGMLGGTYPNPDVVALKSATTTVAISAAAAPSANQALVATNGSAATWQNILKAILAGPTNVANTNITAAVNTFYTVDPSSANCTLTLPTTHAAGDFIWIQQTRWGNGVRITVPSGHTVNDVANGGTTVQLIESYNASGGTLRQGLLYSVSTTAWVLLFGGLVSI